MLQRHKKVVAVTSLPLLKQQKNCIGYTVIVLKQNKQFISYIVTVTGVADPEAAATGEAATGAANKGGAAATGTAATGGAARQQKQCDLLMEMQPPLELKYKE